MMGIFRGLLLDHRWRTVVGRGRFLWFTFTRRLRTQTSRWARRNTTSHNLTAFDHLNTDFSMPRMPRLIHAVLAIESVGKDSRILVIGPRTENDLLLLYGFGHTNTIGIDMISYSPWIVAGDMHALPFAEGSFDVVICGWTLSYSTNPQLACDEMVRVLKDGGVVAIGVEHVPADKRVTPERDTRLVDPTEDSGRINSTAHILELLGDSVRHCFVDIDAPLRHLSPEELECRTGLASSQCVVVASVAKSH